MPRAARLRLDLLLVERGLAPTREKARGMILAGLVTSRGARLDKPGALVAEDAEILVAAGRRFVGRGGEKLEGLLEALVLDVRGATALDVGASTGGFTDCLLQRGAGRIVALDVGRGQLDWKLRNDPRVAVLEGVNVRYLDHSRVPAPFDLVVVDVSFISLRLVLPVLFPLLRRADARAPGRGPEPAAALPMLLALLKPQFEVGRGNVGRGGIVTDPQQHLRVLLEVAEALAAAPSMVRGDRDPDPATHAGDLPLQQCGSVGLVRILESTIRGAEGNREFFLCFGTGSCLTGGALEQEARRAVSG